MKELVIQFLKQNGFKVAIAIFLTIVAFQDQLSFNINLKNQGQQKPTKEEPGIIAPTKQEILSTNQVAERAKKPNRFNLQPFLPTWRKKDNSEVTLAAKKRPEIRDDVSALAKLASIEPEDLDAFIRRFTHVAISEQKKYGIPASVTIGNSLLLSTANHGKLAQNHLNFFKLPCTPDWDGRQTISYGDCYRQYDTAWLSFRDHSNYLKQIKENRGIELAPTDYKAWAKFLHQENFGYEKNYHKQLIQLIEDMELYYLDRS
jgi:flagellum-specific peptidoglycan hydrolase FlgJ